MELMLGKPHFVKSKENKLVKHDYKKCNRCWNYFVELKNNELCLSCYDAENK